MIIVSFFALAILSAMIIGYISHDGAEDLKREQLALEIRSEIEVYHKIKGKYPNSLSELPIYQKNDFKSYLDEGIFRYYISNASEKARYQLVWVYSGAMKKEGGVHSVAWSGRQYSNDKSFLNLMSEDEKPDKNGFYLIDLH